MDKTELSPDSICDLCEGLDHLTQVDAAKLCTWCLGWLRDPKSLAGHAMRRHARSVRRRHLVKGETQDEFMSDRCKRLAKERFRRYCARPGARLKQAARYRIQTLVRTGALIRPEVCPRCKRKPPKTAHGHSQIHFHHTNGYDQANWEVGEWFCRQCHFDTEKLPKRRRPLEEIAREVVDD